MKSYKQTSTFNIDSVGGSGSFSFIGNVRGVYNGLAGTVREARGIYQV